MAIVDVSKIPNNSKFDPVREAILELEGNILSGVAGVSSLNGQTGNVNIVAGENITVSANNGAIVISSTATGGGGGTLDNPLTLTAGNGVLLSSPSVFDGSSALEITISHSDTSDVANKSLTGGGVIQSLTFDEFGHVQTVGSSDLDQRYLAFRTIKTNNDNQETTATLYNDIIEFEGSGSISVTKSPVSNEIRFGLSVSDIRFQDGKRVARGFLYYQGNVSEPEWGASSSNWSTNDNFWGIQEPTVGDLPTGSTFDFTSNTINVNDPNWAETPPTTGYAFTTYFVVRYTSIDEGGTGEDARPVTYGDVTDAVGFEGPVTFNSLSEELGENGFTVIDGARIKTGIISSLLLDRANIDAGTSVFTSNGSYFDLSTGDIATTEFSVLDGNAYFKGDVTGASGTFGDVDFNKNGYLINASGFTLDLNGNVTIGGSKFVIPVYADDASGTNKSFTLLAGQEYVLFYESDVPISELSINDITGTWTRFVGEQGIQGPVGPQGIQGDTGPQGPEGPAGDDGSNGLRSITGLVFYQFGSETPPAAPTASYFDFNTLTFVGLTFGWATETPEMEAGTSTNRYYSAYYSIVETFAGSGIGVTPNQSSVIFDTPQRSFAFNQVVTFSSDANTGTTVINGGSISTFSIESADYVSVSGSPFSSSGMKIDLVNDSIETPNFAVDSSGGAYFSAGLVTVQDNVISIGASTNYTSKGVIQFNDDNGQSAASISTNLTQLGPLTVSELLIEADTFLRLQAPNIVIDASSNLSFGSQYDRVSDYTGGVATTEQNHSIQLAGGAIIKWGYQSNSAVTHFVPFPTAFPTNCSSVSITTNRSSQSNNGANYAYSVSRTGFVAVLDADYDFWWIAIGF